MLTATGIMGVCQFGTGKVEDPHRLMPNSAEGELKELFGSQLLTFGKV